MWLWAGDAEVTEADDDALPMLSEIPLDELLTSEDWRLSRAASRVLQSLDPASYAAHGTSPVAAD